MSGIYIHGMEMPKDGYIDVRLFSDGCAYIQTGEHPYHRAFKVIELPPHGRLVDADALLKDHGLETYCPEITRDERLFQYEMFRPTMDFCKWVEDAKTIIPPEGGADG